MKKSQGRRVMGILLIVLLITHTSSLITAALATEASQAAIPASLQQKISALKQEIASKAASLKLEVNKRLQNKVYAGQIMDKTAAKIGSSRITLNTKDGLKMVLINEYTDYSDQVSKKSAVSLKTLANGDLVAALGDIDDKNNLVAKKVVKLTPPQKNLQIIWGQVQSININTLVIKNRDGQKISVVTTADTDFFLASNEASLNDVKLDRLIVSNGSQVDTGVSKSRFIYIIPPDSLKLDKPKNSSQSATPSALPKKSS